MANWFSNFANSAMKMADDIADSLVSSATDMRDQIREEQTRILNEERQKQKIFNDRHLLPWETDIESRQILSNDLMEKVMTLSVHERNFTVKAPNSHEVEFYFQEFVPVAMQLLQLDSNLARMHAKLTPKVNEEDLWFNYYCRIVYLRGKSGIDGPEALSSSSKWSEAEILLDSEPETVAAAPLINPTSSKSGTGNASYAATTAAKGSKDSLSKQGATSSAKKSSYSDEDELDLNDLDDDLDDSNLKDMELLEELGDISPEDFEQIGSSECNDELEAQIAQELAEGGDL